MIEYIYGFINTIVYILVLAYFSNSLIKLNRHKNYSPIVHSLFFVLWIAIEYTVSVTLNNYVFTKMVIIVLINCLMIYIWYDKRFLKCIFIAFIYQALVLLCDYISMVFLMKVNQQINLENITSSLSGFMVSILSQVVLISLVFTIIRISKKDELLTDQTWIKLSIMPVISILCITAMYINFTESSTDHQKNTILLLSIVFIFINLYVYYLVYEVAAGKEAEGKARLLKEKNNQIYKSYIETVGNYKYIRKKEHEYQNILLALLALAKEDNNEEIINVVEKELDIKDDREYHFDTNNSVTNLIFNHMYHVAEEKNILLSYKFNDLSKIPLSERDIAVLYCNLIKNSIEACDKLAEKRRIFVSSHCQESNFILKIENQFDGQLRQDNNKLFSINKNPDEHGYGLENIKEIVTKYDGFLTNEIDGNLFRIVIVIPIENYERDRKI